MKGCIMISPSFPKKYKASEFLNNLDSYNRAKASRLYNRFVFNIERSPDKYFKKLVYQDEIANVDKTYWTEPKAGSYLKNLLHAFYMDAIEPVQEDFIFLRGKNDALEGEPMLHDGLNYLRGYKSGLIENQRSSRSEQCLKNLKNTSE
jgi:hypothetical protein